MIRRLIRAAMTRVLWGPMGARIGDVARQVTKETMLRSEERTDAGTQLLLMLSYQERVKRGHAPLRLRDVEFRNYSQSGEDGILLYIFSIIGFRSRYCIDLGVGNGTVSNVTNLVLNHGFYGLLLDAEGTNVRDAKTLFGAHPSSSLFPPQVRTVNVTDENVDSILREADVPMDVDLLSIDIDGFDYWVLAGLSVSRPRVIILEYNNLWGPEPALTVPRHANLVPRYLETPSGLYSGYCGATLRAFDSLLTARGYRLVGVGRYCFNALFVLEEECGTCLPRVPIEDCFDHPMCRYTAAKLLPLVKSLEWTRV